MPRIDELYAFIQEDTGPDDEGICATLAAYSDIWMPLVGADLARIASLRTQAQIAANASGKPVKLVHFTHREEGEIIRPTYDRK